VNAKNAFQQQLYKVRSRARSSASLSAANLKKVLDYLEEVEHWLENACTQGKEFIDQKLKDFEDFVDKYSLSDKKSDL